MLAEQIGKDGYHLLLSIANAGGATVGEKVPATVTLRQVWEQQYDLEASPGYRRLCGTERENL